MGALIPPASGLVHLDANLIIHALEKHVVYGPLLQALGAAAHLNDLVILQGGEGCAD